MNYKEKYPDFSELIGQTFTSVVNTGEAFILKNDEREYSIHHSQDCCESVYIDDVVGDLDDLTNTPITFATEEYNSDAPKSETYGEGEKAHTYVDESSTWSFYKLGTVKGWVDIKFYGSSNGYYSETADLVRLK